MAGAYPYLGRRYGTRRGLVASVASSFSVANLFATSLYTGTGAAQTITNGLDLAGQGGLQWDKSRSTANDHTLYDTARGAGKFLVTDSTVAETTGVATQGFTSTGFSTAAYVNGDSRVTWAFRQHPRFFKVITVTTDGSGAFSVATGLDAAVSVGMVVAKDRDNASQWPVWHRSLGNGNRLYLNSAGAAAASTQLTVSGLTINGVGFTAGARIILYVFAHDTASDGVIQCGSLLDGATATLSWRPQYLLTKCATTTSNWLVFDTSRGWGATDLPLAVNTAASEADLGGGSFNYGAPTSTGFTFTNSQGGETQLYLVIRAVGG